MRFTDFSLKPELLKALEAKGFVTPTPIQASALPLALEGRDILGQARTGTGKTLAFALPIANRLALSSERGRRPRAFVLTPTRELAVQVSGEIAGVSGGLHVEAVYGGTGYGKQAEALRRGTDVVVATPGRALDYLRQKVLDLSGVEIAVLDEADEMLSMGFTEEVEALLAAIPSQRQVLLFSATLPAWARKLAERHMHGPVLINVMKEERISYGEISLQAPLTSRIAALSDSLFTMAPEKAIVFGGTKAETDELASALIARGHPAAAIHGDLNQKEREVVMGRFRAGEVSVLVATDVAARGLDIPEVDLVVHFRLPASAESYQHRSGRTGRAGREGMVLVLFGPRERRALEVLERNVGRRFKRINPPTPEEVMEARWLRLAARLEAQDPRDRDAWEEHAGRIIAEGRIEAVAGMLSLLLGKAPPPLSLLTGEEGWVTLMVRGKNLSVPRIMGTLRDAGAGQVGRIVLAGDSAWADVPSQRVADIDPGLLKGLQVSQANEPPKDVPHPPAHRPQRPGSYPSKGPFNKGFKGRR